MARITIVNDDRNILNFLRLDFEAEGYTVDTFQDPVIALPKVIFEPPNILILNGWMPRMHGIEFFKMFRRYSRAKVIILSFSAEEIEEHLAEIGLSADAYFYSPFPTRSLIVASNKLLRAA